MTVAELPEQTALAPIQTEAVQLADEVMGLTITDQESYLNAVDRQKAITATIRAWKAAVDPVVDKANKAHKEACGLRTKFLAPLEAAQRRNGKQITEWENREAVSRRQEEERIRETLRLAAEAQAKQALIESSRLEQAGEEAAAQEVMDKARQAAQVPTIRLPEPPRAKGIVRTVNWKFRIVDAALVPREYLIPDEKKIGQVIRAGKGSVKIPGVEAFADEGCR